VGPQLALFFINITTQRIVLKSIAIDSLTKQAHNYEGA